MWSLRSSNPNPCDFYSRNVLKDEVHNNNGRSKAVREQPSELSVFSFTRRTLTCNDYRVYHMRCLSANRREELPQTSSTMASKKLTRTPLTENPTAAIVALTAVKRKALHVKTGTGSSIKCMG